MAIQRRRHPIQASLQANPGSRELSLEPPFEPGARRTHARLATKGGQLEPEVGADVGIALRGPARALGTATTSRELDAERLA